MFEHQIDFEAKMNRVTFEISAQNKFRRLACGKSSFLNYNRLKLLNAMIFKFYFCTHCEKLIFNIQNNLDLLSIRKLIGNVCRLLTWNFDYLISFYVTQ